MSDGSKRLLPKYLLALILLSALFLPSCSTQKKIQNTRQEQVSNIEQHTRIEQEQHRTVRTDTATELSADEKVVITTREYDTSRPVDKTTGTPPLLRETVQTRERVETAQQTRTEEQADQTATIAEQNTKTQQETILQVETKERQGLNGLQKALCTLGALTVIALLAWLGLKLYKRFLKPL